jgi:hypothetical protein
MLNQFLFAFILAAGLVSVSHAAGSTIPAQTSNELGVKVTVMPLNLAQGAKTWEFEVTLETHTQALGDDLTKAAVLIADGKRYHPAGWEGAPPGGHHRKGLLRFRAIEPSPHAIELQILLSGDTSPRSFRWSLK